MVKKRTCVFISGKGTNLKNLISYSRDKSFPIKISLIICNNNKAEGIKYAKLHNIPLILVNTKNKNSDNKILLQLKNYKISFICLAGYMKIISKKITNIFEKRIINIHPSLLPKYGGKGFYGKKVHEAVLNNGETVSGCTVHIVNEIYDDGPILGQTEVPVFDDDSTIDLAQRVLVEEHKLYPKAILKILNL